MAQKLSDKIIKALPAPEHGNGITYDSEVKGFGVRVTAGAARSFILNYRVHGRERRLTIGSFPDWVCAAARGEAKELKKRIDRGECTGGGRNGDPGQPVPDGLRDLVTQRGHRER